MPYTFEPMSLIFTTKFEQIAYSKFAFWQGFDSYEINL